MSSYVFQPQKKRNPFDDDDKSIVSFKKPRTNYPSAASYCSNNTAHVAKVPLEDDIANLTNTLNAMYLENSTKMQKNNTNVYKYNNDLKQLNKLENEYVQDEKEIKVGTGIKLKSVSLKSKMLENVNKLKQKLSIPRLLIVYEVRLIYDNREDKNLNLVNVLKKLAPGMVHEAQLKVGDFLILLNGKLVIAIERKKTDDLCGSIKDARLKKQTGNMELLFGNLTRIVLLIEKRRSGNDFKCNCIGNEFETRLQIEEQKENVPANIHHISRKIDSLLYELQHQMQKNGSATDADDDDFAVISEHIHEKVAEYCQKISSTKELDLKPHCADDLCWLFGDEQSYDHEGSISRSQLVGAMVNRLIIQGFIPFVSESDTYSAFILLKMMYALHNKGKEVMAKFGNQPDFDVYSTLEDTNQLTGDALKEFIGTRQLPQIKEDDIPSTLSLNESQRVFALQLRCLDKFTPDYIWLLLEKYKTPVALFTRLQSCNGEEQKIEQFVNELSQLKPVSGTRFGPARAIGVYNHFMGTNYDTKPGVKGKPDKLIKIGGGTSVSSSASTTML